MSFSPNTNNNETKRPRGRPRKMMSDEPTVTPEFEYSRHMLAQEIYKRKGDDVFVWDGERWTIAKDGLTHAVNWLAENRPDKYKYAVAESLWNTLTLALPHLRLLSENEDEPRYIVPTHGMWLEIDVTRDENGRTTGGVIRKRKPNKELGVTGDVPVLIKGEDGEEYLPRPIFSDSRFARFLRTSFPQEGNDETRRDRQEALEAIQEYAGYTLMTGSPNEQVAHLWRGSGGNGKGVMKSLISRFHKKSAAVNLEEIGKDFGYMQLLDASLALVDETPSTFSPERLKSLVSGDPLPLNRKYRDPIPDFRCDARWIINSNQNFGFRSVDTSPGFFRRFIIIDWTAKPEQDGKIAGLDKLIFKQEPEMVLDWLLIGLLRYLENGSLFIPAASHRFKEAAMTAADSVHAFLADHGWTSIVVGPGELGMSKEEIYEQYCEYCSVSGRQRLQNSNFFKAVKEKLVERGGSYAELAKKKVGGRNLRYTNLDLKRGDVDALSLSPIRVSKRKRAATFEEIYGVTTEATPPSSLPRAKPLPQSSDITPEEEAELEEFFGGFIE